MSEKTDKTMAVVREKWDPTFDYVQSDFIPWTPLPAPVSRLRLGFISTAGVYQAALGHVPFDHQHPYGDTGFREFPSTVRAADLAIAHSHYNHAYADQDRNVVFPIDRLQELAAERVIGELAPKVYSFMGYISRPLSLLAESIPEVVQRLRQMQVEAVLLNGV